MQIYRSTLSLVLVTVLAGCGAQAAGTASSDGAGHVDGGASASGGVVSTIAAGQEISTSFAKEKAAAAPAEPYPTF